MLGLSGCQGGDIEQAEPSEVAPSEISSVAKQGEEMATDVIDVPSVSPLAKVIVGRDIRPSADAVMQLGNKVADWQIATFDTHHKYRGIPTKWLEREFAYKPYGDLVWHMGTLYTGLDEWYQVSENAAIRDFLIEIGERNEWKLQGKGSMNPYYADGHAVAQFYLSLYEELQRPEMIAPTQERFDWIIANPKTGSLEWSGWGEDKYRTDCHYRWGWCDALFMAPPVWARLANATRDRKYLDFMDQEYLATYETLWDKEAQLFWRDTSYFDQREANGEKVFWSRGNGWVFGGLALLIPELPEAWERRESYIKLYRVMAESIRKTQRADGSWSMGMLGDVEQYPEVETSGTAFFVYGLAWGINEGLLDPKVFESAVFRGWDVLAQCVTEEGMLGYVQPVGAAPGQSFADKTEVYGTGAFLAAAAEMYRLVSSPPKVAQPVATPKPAAVEQPVADAGFIPRPTVTDDATLLLQEDFEAGVYSLKNSGNRPEVVELSDARSGKYALQSQITATTESKYRTETSMNKKDLIFEVGKEYWLGMSIKLGDDYADGRNLNDQGMLMQFHYFDWNFPDVPDAQPLLLRYIGDDTIAIDNEVFKVKGTGERHMATVPADIGEWVDWVFHYKLDDVDGIIRIWRNGELVVDFTGDNHQIEKHDGAYLKFGLYASQFKNLTTMPDEASRTVYHDEIRIAGADGSYELVAPGGDSIRPISSKR
jgi:rhamnogalacturonyl hydrolase YesR